MSSNTVQETSLNAQALEQLETEVKQELIAVLNKSQLGNILAKYGLSSQEVLKIQYKLDLNVVEACDSNQDMVAIESFSLPMMKPPIETNLILRQPCPIDGNPDGCWVDG